MMFFFVVIKNRLNTNEHLKLEFKYEYHSLLIIKESGVFIILFYE